MTKNEQYQQNFRKGKTWAWWLMPEILASQELEIRRNMV
jgi:hypothetical protein